MHPNRTTPAARRYLHGGGGGGPMATLSRRGIRTALKVTLGFIILFLTVRTVSFILITTPHNPPGVEKSGVADSRGAHDAADSSRQSSSSNVLTVAVDPQQLSLPVIQGEQKHKNKIGKGRFVPNVGFITIPVGEDEERAGRGGTQQHRGGDGDRNKRDVHSGDGEDISPIGLAPRSELPYCDPQTSRAFLVALNNNMFGADITNNNIKARRAGAEVVAGGADAAKAPQLLLPLHKSNVPISKVKADVMRIVGPVAATASDMSEADLAIVLEGTASGGSVVVDGSIDKELFLFGALAPSTEESVDKDSRLVGKGKEHHKVRTKKGDAHSTSNDELALFDEEPTTPHGSVLHAGWHCVSVVKMKTKTTTGGGGRGARERSQNNRDEGNAMHQHQEAGIVLQVVDPVVGLGDALPAEYHGDNIAHHDSPAGKALGTDQQYKELDAKIRKTARPKNSGDDERDTSLVVREPECIIAQKPFVTTDTGAHKGSELGVTPHQLAPIVHTPLDMHMKDTDGLTTKAHRAAAVSGNAMRPRQLLAMAPAAHVEGLPAVVAIIRMPDSLLDGTHGNRESQHQSSHVYMYDAHSSMAVFRGPFVEEVLFNSPSDDDDEEILVLNDPNYDPNNAALSRKKRNKRRWLNEDPASTTADDTLSQQKQRQDNAADDTLQQRGQLIEDELAIRKLMAQHDREAFQSLRLLNFGDSGGGNPSIPRAKTSARKRKGGEISADFAPSIPLFDGRGSFWVIPATDDTSGRGEKLEDSGEKWQQRDGNRGEAVGMPTPPLLRGEEEGELSHWAKLRGVVPSHRRHFYTRQRAVHSLLDVEGIGVTRGAASLSSSLIDTVSRRQLEEKGGAENSGAENSGAENSGKLNNDELSELGAKGKSGARGRRILTVSNEKEFLAALTDLHMYEDYSTEETNGGRDDMLKGNSADHAAALRNNNKIIYVRSTIRIQKHLSITASAWCSTIIFSRDAQLVVEDGVVLRIRGSVDELRRTHELKLDDDNGKKGRGPSFAASESARSIESIVPLTLTASSVESGWGGIVVGPTGHLYASFVIISFTGSNGVKKIAGTGSHTKFAPAITVSPLAIADSSRYKRIKDAIAEEDGGDGVIVRPAQGGRAGGFEIAARVDVAGDGGSGAIRGGRGSPGKGVRPPGSAVYDDDFFDVFVKFSTLLARIGKLDAKSGGARVSSATKVASLPSPKAAVFLQTILSLKHSAVVNCYGGGLGIGKGAHATIRNVVAQDLAQGLECVECSLHVDGGTFTDFPFVSNSFKFADEDNDGLYVRGGTALINNSIIGNLLDDGIDSACNKNDPEESRITIANTHIFNCQHEGIAISGSAGATRFMRIEHSIIERCQQGVENGHSPMSHYSSLYKTILARNQIGLRFGDDYPLEVAGGLVGNRNVFIDNVVPYVDYVKKEHKDAHTILKGMGTRGFGFGLEGGEGGARKGSQADAFLWSNPLVDEAGLSATYSHHALGICSDCQIIHPIRKSKNVRNGHGELESGAVAGALDEAAAKGNNVFLFLSHFASEGFVCGAKALGGFAYTN